MKTFRCNRSDAPSDEVGAAEFMGEVLIFCGHQFGGRCLYLTPQDALKFAKRVRKAARKAMEAEGYES